MQSRLKKYFALTRAGILETMQYRLALFVMVIGNLLYLTLTYFLWKAIFASSGSDVVNGMTFEMTMVYLVLASSLYGVVELYLVWEIGRAIQKGKIVLDLLRPMKYKRYLFFANSGTLVVNFFMTFIPTFIIVLLITGKTIALGTGVGIRYDLEFLVLRFDLGIGIHAPYDTGKSGYYNMPSFGKSLGYHFAIGYPF